MLPIFPSIVIAVALAATMITKTHAEVDCNNPPPDYLPKDVEAPMRFFKPEVDVCLGNAVNNPYLAVGVITEATPKVFAEFAVKNLPEAPIEFISPGGNFVAALKLGEQIRERKYDTSLGELCASACAYAILGGVHRYTVEKKLDEDSDYDSRNIGATGTKLGVHQFYRSNSLSESQKKAFSAIDLSIDQVIIGLLLEYTMRMGISTRMVLAASKISPWEEIYWLSPKEMLDWNIDNTHRRYTELSFQAFGRSGSYVEVANSRGSDVSYLRIFCQKGKVEPLFSFITDHPVPKTSQSLSVADEIKSSVDAAHELLPQLNFQYRLGSKNVSTAIQIDDIQAVQQGKDIVRTFATVRPKGVSRQEVENFTQIALVDKGELARSEWTVQDFLKFRIQGDRRLIRLAMRNCTS